MKRFELWHDAKGVIKIPQGYHCAHIMSRVHYSTRWAEDNAIGLCYGCHAWFDREHQARWDFLKTRGYTDDSIDQLRYRSHQKFGGDYQLLELYLKQRLGQLLTRGAL